MYSVLEKTAGIGTEIETLVPNASATVHQTYIYIASVLGHN